MPEADETIRARLWVESLVFSVVSVLFLFLRLSVFAGLKSFRLIQTISGYGVQDRGRGATVVLAEMNVARVA